MVDVLVPHSAQILNFCISKAVYALVRISHNGYAYWVLCIPVLCVLCKKSHKFVLDIICILKFIDKNCFNIRDTFRMLFQKLHATNEEVIVVQKIR